MKGSFFALVKACFYSSGKRFLWICVGSATTTEGLDNIDKSSVVLDSPLGATGLLLFLLLRIDFGSLTSDLSSTSQRSVNLKFKKGKINKYQTIYKTKMEFEFGFCNISDCDHENWWNSSGLTQKCSRRFIYFQMTTHKAQVGANSWCFYGRWFSKVTYQIKLDFVSKNY